MRMLNIPIQFTTKTEEFIPYKGPKISYAEKPILDEISIKPHSLLFEQGVSNIDIHINHIANSDGDDFHGPRKCQRSIYRGRECQS